MEQHLDPRLLNKVNNELSGFNRIICYGTGAYAEYIMPYFEKTGVLNKIIAFVDQDESNMIGKRFHGFPVIKYSEAYEKGEVIVIVSAMFWQTIKDRLFRLGAKYQCRIPVKAIYEFYPKKTRENSPQDYIKYVDYIENRRYDKSKFVPYSEVEYVREESDTKVIAFYLPQYYRIGINDTHHGAGFTEWTNSSQAIPFFCGHNQPQIPYDVGYYSLTTADVMKRQIELAKHYGLYGFCFHYYWFSGEKIMEKPIELFLSHKELEMPFCLNWATENWTQAWDGNSIDVILGQKERNQDPDLFMKDILPYFRDERYIKIDGKPLLLIYTLNVFEDSYAKSMIQRFRQIAIEQGFPGLYILVSNYADYDGGENREFGIDGLVEFPPSFLGSNCELYQPDGYINPYFQGAIYNLKQFIRERKYVRDYPAATVFRTAMVSFDNTARKPLWGGDIYYGSTPDLYGQWLLDAQLMNINENRNEDKNIVFVNSWNEWAEACHLEPDLFWGYGYLEATRDAIYNARGLDTDTLSERAGEALKECEKIKFIVSCVGTIGSVIECEPIIRYLKREYSGCEIIIIVLSEHVELVKYNRSIDEIINVYSLNEAEGVVERLSTESNAVVVDLQFNGQKCERTGRVHRNMINPQITNRSLKKYGSMQSGQCLAAGFQPLHVRPRFHFKRGIHNPFANEKYIVFNCKSREMKVGWVPQKWNDFAETLCNLGFKIVEIGDEPTVWTENKNYVDFTKEKDLQVVASIIKESSFFVGVESEFVYMANCLQKKSLILMDADSDSIPFTGYFEKNVINLKRVKQQDLDKVTVQEMVDCICKRLSREIR